MKRIIISAKRNNRLHEEDESSKLPTYNEEIRNNKISMEWIQSHGNKAIREWLRGIVIPLEELNPSNVTIQKEYKNIQKMVDNFNKKQGTNYLPPTLPFFIKYLKENTEVSEIGNGEIADLDWLIDEVGEEKIERLVSNYKSASDAKKIGPKSQSTKMTTQLFNDVIDKYNREHSSEDQLLPYPVEGVVDYLKSFFFKDSNEFGRDVVGVVVGQINDKSKGPMEERLQQLKQLEKDYLEADGDEGEIIISKYYDLLSDIVLDLTSELTNPTITVAEKHGKETYHVPVRYTTLNNNYTTPSSIKQAILDKYEIDTDLGFVNK